MELARRSDAEELRKDRPSIGDMRQSPIIESFTAVENIVDRRVRRAR